MFPVVNLETSLRPCGNPRACSKECSPIISIPSVLVRMHPLGCWVYVFSLFHFHSSEFSAYPRRTNHFRVTAIPMGVEPPCYYGGILIWSWFFSCVFAYFWEEASLCVLSPSYIIVSLLKLPQLSFPLSPSIVFARRRSPVRRGAGENQTTLLRGDERGLNISHLILSPQLTAHRRHPTLFLSGSQIIQSESRPGPAVMQRGAERRSVVTGSPFPVLSALCNRGRPLAPPGQPAGC